MNWVRLGRLWQGRSRGVGRSAWVAVGATLALLAAAGALAFQAAQ